MSLCILSFLLIVQYDDHLADIRTCLYQHITFYYVCWKGLEDFSGNDLLFFSEHRAISKISLRTLSESFIYCCSLVSMILKCGFALQW